MLIGLEHTAHLYPALIGDAPGPDPAIAGPEVVAASRAAIEADPSIASLLCECTNLPPYRSELRAATGLPVTDIVTVVEPVHASRGLRELKECGAPRSVQLEVRTGMSACSTYADVQLSSVPPKRARKR